MNTDGSSSAGQRANPFGPSMGFDPAKPEGGPEKDHINSRIDLPAEAYSAGATRKVCHYHVLHSHTAGD